MEKIVSIWLTAGLDQRPDQNISVCKVRTDVAVSARERTGNVKMCYE